MAAERGEDLAQSVAGRPEVAPHLLFVWRAFWDLNHDRPLGFGAAGPIPFTSVDRYAIRYGITDPDEFERFFFLIRDMDGTYMTEMAKRKPRT